MTAAAGPRLPPPRAAAPLDIPAPPPCTRPGIKREGEILSATTRVGEDGRTYYDLVIRMASYASRNPYVATQAEVRPATLLKSTL